MTPQKRFWMGFWAFAPLIAIIPYLIAVFAMVFGMLATMPMTPGSPPPNPEEFIGSIIGLWGIIIVFALVLSALNITGLIMYLIHAVKDKRPDAQANRTMWILLIVLLGSIGRMVYYFVRVRTDVLNNEFKELRS